MAINQYDFYMIPKSELIEQFGIEPSRLSVEEFEQCQFWSTCQPVQDFAARFTEWRKEIVTWSPKEIRWWGTEESNRIDVWQEDGRVNTIEFRVELQVLDLNFIHVILDVARDSNCVLFSAHSGKIIQPLREHLLEYLVRSSGANAVWDWQRNPRVVPKKQTPQIFLSHSSVDKSFVSKLAIDLRSHEIPVWYDKWELKVGDSLNSKIAAGISGSGWLVVVLSKNSVKSSWVERELNTALAIELQQQEVFVLPIVIDDCTIPPFLLDKLYADFRKSYQFGLNSLLDRVFDNIKN